MNAVASIEVLNSVERARAARFARADDREHYVATHLFVREIIASYLDCLPVAVPLRASAFGQPLIIGHEQQLQYSLAHCAEYAVVAVSVATAVGVDIECARAVPNAVAIAERFFAADEAQIVRSVGAEHRNAVFLQLWTSKEAFVKAIGLGLRYDLRSFSVAGAEGTSPYFRSIETPYGPPSQWSLVSKHSRSCIVAVAIRATNAVVIDVGLVWGGER